MRRLHLNFAAILIFLISSCGSRSGDVSITAIPSPTPFQPLNGSASDSPYSAVAPTPIYLPTVTPVPPTPTPMPTPTISPAEIDPLTGLRPADPSLLARRPMAIKVANYPRYIRPQSGLSLADNVFEYYIEGGLTRFVAILYGNNSDWVGPVRSGRFFDENMQRMYHAYLVFKFADPRVLSYFKTTDFADYLVVPGFGACPPFRLMESRKIEVYNNSYFNTSAWEDCVQRKGLENRRPYIRRGLFSDAPPASGLPGTLIYTYFSQDSYHYWQYVPETGQYLRFQEVSDTRDGRQEKYAAQTDNVTHEQIHAANIIFLFAYHTFANAYDQEDEVYHIDLSGSGEAYVFRDGMGIVAKWNRPSVDQPLLLTDPGGTPIPLHPGVTFYEVLGTNSYVDQGEGEWDFHHATP